MGSLFLYMTVFETDVHFTGSTCDRCQQEARTDNPIVELYELDPDDNIIFICEECLKSILWKARKT